MARARRRQATPVEWKVAESAQPEAPVEMRPPVRQRAPAERASLAEGPLLAEGGPARAERQLRAERRPSLQRLRPAELRAPRAAPVERRQPEEPRALANAFQETIHAATTALFSPVTIVVIGQPRALRATTFVRTSSARGSASRQPTPAARTILCSRVMATALGHPRELLVTMSVETTLARGSARSDKPPAAGTRCARAIPTVTGRLRALRAIWATPAIPRREAAPVPSLRARTVDVSTQPRIH
jgi:hypothetical protein